MKIVIAAKHPPGGRLAIGGVQTWSLTVGSELEKRGHSVVYWGPEFHLPSIDFDIGLIANHKNTFKIESQCKKLVRISHGIIDAERGGPGFLATSEEVKNKWNCKGIIRQPLDLNFWSPADQVKRKYLTRHSYRKGLNDLPGIADQLKLQFLHIWRASPTQVRDQLRRSVCVVATGRAAVEAMACGAAVVIADDRPYQGPLMDPDTFGSMVRNYSGRGGFVPTRPTLKQQIMKEVTTSSKNQPRQHVIAHHDVRDIVRTLLTVAKS